MQHIIFWSIFLLIAACERQEPEYWYVDQLPAEVVITDERLEPYLDTIQKSVDGYNELFTTPIFHLKIGYSADTTECGKIFMMVVVHNEGGETRHDFCNNIQSISMGMLDTGDLLRLTIQHELGHSLGLAHSEDVESVMYYTNDFSQWDAWNQVWLEHLTEKDLQNIVDRYDVNLR